MPWYYWIPFHIFLSVECVLVLFYLVFYFSARGTRYSIVQFHFIFSLCGLVFGIAAFLCYIFLHSSGMRSSIVWFCFIFFCVWNVLYYCWQLLLFYSSSVLCYGILDISAIYFWMSKRLRYCGMMYNIFLCVQRALVLCKFVLYFSACRTCFGIIKFNVILFCVWTMLWNCEIFCSMFLQMEYALILWNSF